MISVPILTSSQSMQVLTMVVFRLWVKGRLWLLSRTKGLKVETILLRDSLRMDEGVLSGKAHRRRSHLR